MPAMSPTPDALLLISAVALSVPVWRIFSPVRGCVEPEETAREKAGTSCGGIKRIHHRGALIKVLDKPHLDLTTALGRGNLVEPAGAIVRQP